MAAGYFPDSRYFGENGHLYPYEFRFDADDRAHLVHRPDGSVLLRVSSETGFIAGNVVLPDGSGVPMERWGHDRRSDYWQATLQPVERVLRFSFAFRHESGKVAYLVPAGVSNAVERLDRWQVDLDALAPLNVPDWMRGAFIYQIFPERFRRGDPATDPPGVEPWGSEPHWHQFQGGDLAGIAEKADYLDGLGVDVVYVNPIFHGGSNHKYDAIDFFSVDPAFGGNEALTALVDALHARGMKLIVDSSFNHCHPQFFAFADIVEHGAESEYRDWFAVTDYPPRVIARPHLLATADVSDPDAYRAYIEGLAERTGLTVEIASDDGPVVETTYECWYGVPTLPRIRLEDPAARRYALDVATHWVREFEIDGWRMDVARYVDADFWSDFRSTVKSVRPDAYLIAEVMGDAGPWLQGDRFDATMNYTFREICLGFFADRSLSGPEFLDGFTRMLARYAPEVIDVSQNLLASHDTERFLTMAGSERDRVVPALVFQMTAPGAPGVYYGEEIGMEGGHEPASRGAFPWDTPESWDTGLQDLIRDLARLRRSHPALRRGDWRRAFESEDTIAFIRSREDERVLVIVNRGPVTGPMAIDVAAPAPTILWGSGEVRSGTGDGLVIEQVPGHSGLVVLL